MCGGSGIHDGCDRWQVRVLAGLQLSPAPWAAFPHCIGAMSLPCLATGEGEILIIFEL